MNASDTVFFNLTPTPDVSPSKKQAVRLVNSVSILDSANFLSNTEFGYKTRYFAEMVSSLDPIGFI